MILTDYIGVLRSTARKIPRSGLERLSGGRLFQSLAVQGKNEYICGLIRENLGQRYINITRNAIGPKSGQKDCRKF